MWINLLTKDFHTNVCIVSSMIELRTRSSQLLSLQSVFGCFTLGIAASLYVFYVYFATASSEEEVRLNEAFSCACGGFYSSLFVSNAQFWFIDVLDTGCS